MRMVVPYAYTRMVCTIRVWYNIRVWYKTLPNQLVRAGAAHWSFAAGDIFSTQDLIQGSDNASNHLNGGVKLCSSVWSRGKAITF